MFYHGNMQVVCCVLDSMLKDYVEMPKVKPILDCDMHISAPLILLAKSKVLVKSVIVQMYLNSVTRYFGRPLNQVLASYSCSELIEHLFVCVVKIPMSSLTSLESLVPASMQRSVKSSLLSGSSIKLSSLSRLFVKSSLSSRSDEIDGNIL